MTAFSKIGEIAVGVRSRFMKFRHRLYLLSAFGLLGLVVAAAANDSAAGPGTKTLTATLATLNLASPTSDLDANLKQSDRRFIGVASYACDAPGVRGSDEPLTRSATYGLRCLEGTGDIIESGEHLRLIQKARDYALAYNKELLRRIHAGLVKSN
jgi:hypothetical protein